MINIGENIKRLRLNRKLTQEALAEFLGVTFQSVSRWERGESYPDITLLPAIASFFDVSFDELMGRDDIEKRKRIKKYIDEYNDLRMKNTPYVLEQMSKAVKEFPGEYDLLVRYLELLIYEKSSADADSESIVEEVEAIYCKILSYCTDDQIRIQAKRLVCMYYNTLGHVTGKEKYVEKKMQIADEMPNMINSKEYLMTVVNLPKDDHFDACRNALGSEMLIFLGTVNNLINYNNEFSVEYRIKAAEKALRILDEFYEDGNYGYCYRSVIYMLGDLGRLCFENGEKEKALFYLEKCAAESKKHDEMPQESEHGALLMEGYVYKKTKYGKTMCERMKGRFLNEYSFSDEFINSNELKRIIKIFE